MKIKFYGASQTVTGSCYIIEANGRRFGVDCGLYQGNAETEKRNWRTAIYRPTEIDFFLITHAHIDHSGLLPRMVKDGFKKRIYATKPTCDLLELMLQDSAHIQEMEAAWKNKKQNRQHSLGEAEPLYDTNDALACIPLFSQVEYNHPFEPCPGVTVTYHDAGHILGSAFILLEVREKDQSTTLLFSGDLGRTGALLMNDHEVIQKTDYLFMEGTYGNRDHKDPESSLKELTEAIKYSYANKEKVIIPAFAVERTQEILYTLHLIMENGDLPEDMPIFLDSPLAISATEVFRRYPDYMDEATNAKLAQGEDPLKLPNLRMCRRSDDSRRINEMQGPAIVISASGMCNAGRIKHHLRHNLWRKGASIVFVGFQAEGTPGRAIVDGAKHINMLGEPIAVAAKIYTIGGFSAHAGQGQLLEWVKPLHGSDTCIFLTHGEKTALETLADLLREHYNMKVVIPAYLDEYNIKAGKLAASPAGGLETKIVWPKIIAELQSELAALSGLGNSLSARSMTRQRNLRDRLEAISKELKNILSGE